MTPAVIRPPKIDVSNIPSVLNPPLYRALQSWCTYKGTRGPQISHMGERGSIAQTIDSVTGELVDEIVDWGERYVIDCPFCGDRRGRMAISHLFGSKVTGRYSNSIWKCFNTECQQDRSNREILRMRLLASPVYREFNSNPNNAPQRVSIQALTPAQFPGTLVSLSSLSKDHPARLYLLGRKPAFDPDALAIAWGLGYSNDTDSWWARGRLIIPVAYRGVVVGYQSRYIGAESDKRIKQLGIQKYLTVFPKSNVLYAYDVVPSSGPVVIMEGATDVWRYGPGAIARFGKQLSLQQAKIIAQSFSHRTLVFVTDGDDPDATPTAIKDCKLLARNGFEGRVSIIPTVKDTDPADYTTQALHRAVTEAVETAIDLSANRGCHASGFNFSSQ